MTAPRFRSRTLRRVFRKTPGGKTVLHHVQRKPSKAKCAVCGSELKAVPRKVTSKMKNTPKTKKRPQRPFGGVLCSACMRRNIIAKTRS
ncbi:MAG: 50S ribosomal protein L34e [Nanoarchaeota archaeon]|nr:50S ribosomal protein L34e [Nanoarchaeota archaeon]